MFYKQHLNQQNTLVAHFLQTALSISFGERLTRLIAASTRMLSMPHGAEAVALGDVEVKFRILLLLLNA